MFVICSRFATNNYQITSMISVYPIVTCIIIVLDRLLTVIYFFLVLKVDSQILLSMEPKVGTSWMII